MRAPGKNLTAVNRSESLNKILLLRGIPLEFGMYFSDSRNRTKIIEKTNPVLVTPIYQQLMPKRGWRRHKKIDQEIRQSG